MKKCPYCKDRFHKSKLKEHLQYEHAAQLHNSLKRLKIALPIVLVGFSVVIGMIWGLLLR